MSSGVSAILLDAGGVMIFPQPDLLRPPLQPVHLDPHGFCPAPDGHPHIRTLTELATRLDTPRQR